MTPGHLSGEHSITLQRTVQLHTDHFSQPGRTCFYFQLGVEVCWLRRISIWKEKWPNKIYFTWYFYLSPTLSCPPYLQGTLSAHLSCEFWSTTYSLIHLKWVFLTRSFCLTFLSTDSIEIKFLQFKRLVERDPEQNPSPFLLSDSSPPLCFTLFCISSLSVERVWTGIEVAAQEAAFPSVTCKLITC